MNRYYFYRVHSRKIAARRISVYSHLFLQQPVSPTPPSEHVWYVPRVIPDTPHHPRGQHRDLLAIYAEAREPPMPTSSDAFALFHHLVPVTSLSVKIPLRGCVFKESIRVCTP